MEQLTMGNWGKFKTEDIELPAPLGDLPAGGESLTEKEKRVSRLPVKGVKPGMIRFSDETGGFGTPTHSFESGEIPRDAGINQAVNHAESVEEDWQEKALSFFLDWLDPWWNREPFAIEQVREDASRFGKVPEPPSKRAWGSIAREAARRGWIRKVGFIQVRNPLAHCANANLWESCL